MKQKWKGQDQKNARGKNLRFLFSVCSYSSLRQCSKQSFVATTFHSSYAEEEFPTMGIFIYNCK